MEAAGGDGVRRTSMITKNYRCYFTDAGDRIRSYEQIECATDTEAALKVDELLASSRDSAAELWQGERLVGRWSVKRHSQIKEAC
jgi:hypothetical protein